MAPVRTGPLYHAMDLRQWLDDLQQDWPTLIVEAARTYGRKVVSKGRGPGSLEPEETAGLDYTVLDAAGVHDHLPWLWRLYHDLVPDIWKLVREEVRASSHALSAINVNLLDGQGARYEAHVDAQPYTLLLFVTSHPWGSGGRLILGDDKDNIGIPPRSGHGIVFDGSTIPHRVEPLGEPGVRVTVPMVYLPARVEERPDGLDHHLYGGGTHAEA